MSKLEGIIFDAMEKMFEKKDRDRIMFWNYFRQKKDYMRVLIENWLTMEKIKSSCDSTYDIILYFYHDEEFCPDCLTQGHVLSYYKRLLGEEVMIFSFDSSLNMSIINALEKAYSIKEYPSIVVNGKTVNGFSSKDEVEVLLSQ